MKLWTNNKFTSVWPVGTAAVVVAKTAEEAAKYLSCSLNEISLPNAEVEDMIELPIEEGQVRILRDGNY